MIHRCVAGPQIGTGHFFRQLALAEEAKARGYDPLLLVTGLTGALADQAEAAGVPVTASSVNVGSEADVRLVKRYAKARASAEVVVDGYAFGPDYYRQIGEVFEVVAAVDDLGEQTFPVDVLVNVNPHALRLNYEQPRQCLLGPRYALLRRQFVEARAQIEEGGDGGAREEVTRVVVTFGGADTGDMTGRSLRALDAAGYRGKADVILGPAASNPKTIRELAAGLKADVRVHFNVRRMSNLLRGQDVALCAAGGMSWELACLGVPMIQTVVADNQKRIAAALEEEGVAIQMGSSNTVESISLAKLFRELANNPTLRARMTRRGMELVDGRGVERVLDTIEAVRGRSRDL